MLYVHSQSNISSANMSMCFLVISDFSHFFFFCFNRLQHALPCKKQFPAIGINRLRGKRITLFVFFVFYRSFFRISAGPMMDRSAGATSKSVLQPKICLLFIRTTARVGHQYGSGELRIGIQLQGEWRKLAVLQTTLIKSKHFFIILYTPIANRSSSAKELLISKIRYILNV